MSQSCSAGVAESSDSGSVEPMEGSDSGERNDGGWIGCDCCVGGSEGSSARPDGASSGETVTGD